MPAMDLKTKLVETHPGSSQAKSVWTWGVPLFSILALAIILATGSNEALFNFLNLAMSSAGDTWWGNITILGDASLGLLIILPLLGRRPDLVWQLVLAAIFASLWSHGMKEIFSSSRPPAILQAGSFHLIGPMLEHNSFPSGHTTTIFVLAGLLAMQQLSAKLKSLMLALAVVVGLSRIACGVHWPMDVLGGMFGGWLSAVAGVTLGQHWKSGLNVQFQRALAILFTLLATWTMFYYDNGIAGTWAFQFIFCTICLLLSLKGQYRLFTVGHKSI